jgi:N-acetylglucosamine kinase-like BadF-type ATPase
VVNDAFGTLRAGVASGPAVAANCGTGAAIAARGQDGGTWHTSFWGEPMGGLAMGEQTLRAVYRAELGIDPPTALTVPVLALYKQESVEDLLHLFTRRLAPPPRNVATLARVLVDAASHGDTTAGAIVRRQAVLLGDYALAAARRVGIATVPFPLVLAGGIFRHRSALLEEGVVARVQTAAPGAWLVERQFEPVAGALLLALERANVPIDDGLLARLTAGMPPTRFFTT